MESYEIAFVRSSQKELDNLPSELIARIMAQLEGLRENPFAHGVIKLKGYEAYRVRVGDYRVIFEVNTQARVMRVLQIVHRGDAYR